MIIKYHKWFKSLLGFILPIIDYTHRFYHLGKGGLVLGRRYEGNIWIVLNYHPCVWMMVTINLPHHIIPYNMLSMDNHPPMSDWWIRKKNIIQIKTLPILSGETSWKNIVELMIIDHNQGLFVNDTPMFFTVTTTNNCQSMSNHCLGQTTPFNQSRRLTMAMITKTP